MKQLKKPCTVTVKNQSYYKSYHLRLHPTPIADSALEEIRLENTIDSGEVHHFADVETMVDFVLDTLLRPAATRTKRLSSVLSKKF